MMKYVNQFWLQHDCLNEYVKRHDEIWPSMIQLIQKAGLQRYSIWNIGNELIECFECDDLEEAKKVLAGSDVKKLWDEYMGEILTVPKSTGFLPLKCVFDFDEIKKRGQL